jgi:hypothetical protein
VVAEIELEPWIDEAKITKLKLVKCQMYGRATLDQGVYEALPAAELRLGRRTALTLPLLPPPQKN